MLDEGYKMTEPADWHAVSGDIRRAVHAVAKDGAEYSARLLYRSARSLMRRLGIHTPAELYEVLRQVFWNSDEHVSFGDHLSVGFGESSRQRQVRAFVAEHPCEPKSVLAMEYERAYGFSAGIAAIWIDLFADSEDVSVLEWLGIETEEVGNDASPEGVQGRAETTDSNTGLASAVEEFCARELTGDICDARLVRSRFAYEFPAATGAAIDIDRLFAAAGFFEDRDLLFRVGKTPGEHFARLIGSRSSFTRGDSGFEDAVWRHPAFRHALQLARDDHRIMLYEPNSYISFSRLHDVLGVRMSDIESYAVSVSAVVPEGVPFTIVSLRAGTTSTQALDAIELPDSFYEGLLDASGLFSSCILAGVRVFAVGLEGRMSANWLVGWLVSRHEGVGRDALQRLLRDELGVSCPTANLVTAIHNSGVFHDDVEDVYYSSMDTWKKEVRNELAK